MDYVCYITFLFHDIFQHAVTDNTVAFLIFCLLVQVIIEFPWDIPLAVTSVHIYLILILKCFCFIFSQIHSLFLVDKCS